MSQSKHTAAEINMTNVKNNKLHGRYTKSAHLMFLAQ